MPCWREILLTHKQHLQRSFPPSRLPSSPSSSPLTTRPCGMTHPFDLLSPPSLLPTSKSRKLIPRNAHEDMKETHVDLQISRSTDKNTGLHTHTHVCTPAQILQGMSEMLGGRMRGNGNTKRSNSSETRKNRAIKPSRQAKNLLMAHIHIRKLRETKGSLSDKAVTSPF